jgi:SAM-dependent methyltransferase
MQKLFQKEWFGIDFKSIVKLDSKKIADSFFYDKFYDEFYKRFSSYEELPEDWKLSKKQVADFILKQTIKSDRLLSIGCGNGYIEFLLWKEGKNIIAVEPSQKSIKFLEQLSEVKIYHGYFPECLGNTKEATFDLAYMSATEYVFDKKELVKLLIEIKDFGVKNFLLVSVCVYNGHSLSRFIKYIAKLMLSFIGLYEIGQFWGYSRTTDELVLAFKKAGFKNIESGFLNKGHFWIKGY